MRERSCHPVNWFYICHKFAINCFEGLVGDEGVDMDLHDALARVSRVPIEIFVKDVNDNAPTFTQPLYAASVREDVSVGRTIIQGTFFVKLLQ